MRAFSTVSRLLPVAALLASAACLQKDVTHTIYVSPTDVTWSVLEKDVRSDERDAVKRTAEEHDYVLAAGAGRHPVAAALGRLGGTTVTATWLRRDRPYTVLTEARFADLRLLALSILHDVGAAGEASLERNGCRTTFTVRLDIASLDHANDDAAAGALLEELDRYRIVLTQGRFVSADGFSIEGDGVVAKADPNKTPEDGVLTLILVWDDEGC